MGASWVLQPIKQHLLHTHIYAFYSYMQKHAHTHTHTQSTFIPVAVIVLCDRCTSNSRSCIKPDRAAAPASPGQKKRSCSWLCRNFA